MLDNEEIKKLPDKELVLVPAWELKLLIQGAETATMLVKWLSGQLYTEARNAK